MMKRKRFAATVLIGLLIVGALGMNFVSTTLASEEATSTQAVHFSKLIEFLPDAFSGWEGEDPAGSTLTYEEGTWSMATKSYTKSGDEDVTAEIGIMDSAFYPVGWWAAWQGFYAYESTEGYAKTVIVKRGVPAWEAYTKDSNDYSLYVGINDRFMVFINTNSGDRATLYEFSDAIDYDGIADLSSSAVPPVETAPPTTPSMTTTPEAPAEEDGEDGGETPGFEVVFAVVGLLAVMTLLRRRR
jgi:PGF-CTERM protein